MNNAIRNIQTYFVKKGWIDLTTNQSSDWLDSIQHNEKEKFEWYLNKYGKDVQLNLTPLMQLTIQHNSLSTLKVLLEKNLPLSVENFKTICSNQSKEIFDYLVSHKDNIKVESGIKNDIIYNSLKNNQLLTTNFIIDFFGDKKLDTAYDEHMFFKLCSEKNLHDIFIKMLQHNYFSPLQPVGN